VFAGKANPIGTVQGILPHTVVTSNAMAAFLMWGQSTVKQVHKPLQYSSLSILPLF
jgi:hypothetical protein